MPPDQPLEAPLHRTPSFIRAQLAAHDVRAVRTGDLALGADLVATGDIEHLKVLLARTLPGDRDHEGPLIDHLLGRRRRRRWLGCAPSVGGRGREPNRREDQAGRRADNRACGGLPTDKQLQIPHGSADRRDGSRLERRDPHLRPAITRAGALPNSNLGAGMRRTRVSRRSRKQKNRMATSCAAR